MKTRSILAIIILISVVSTGFLCGSVSKSGKVGDLFYTHLQRNDFQSIIKMLDKDALKQYTAEEWKKLFISRNQFLGKIKSYKNTGFHTNTVEGTNVSILNYEVDNSNGLVYEEIEFVKRGNDYKILTYRFSPDIAKLKSNYNAPE